jgi:hypothetical protein
VKRPQAFLRFFGFVVVALQRRKAANGQVSPSAEDRFLTRTARLHNREDRVLVRLDPARSAIAARWPKREPRPARVRAPANGSRSAHADPEPLADRTVR